jgi:membrane protein DedA with SNARE-associated domain
VVSSAGRSSDIPALLTSASTRPKTAATRWGQRLHVLLRGHVAGHRDGVGAQVGDGGQGGGGFVEVGQRQCVPRQGQHLGDPAADALGGAGDDGHGRGRDHYPTVPARISSSRGEWHARGVAVGAGITHLVDQAMDSPWIYLALLVLAALDGVVPLVPSETAVITAGVFAATGEPNVILVVAAAALGAYTGDHVSYFIGWFARDRWGRRRQARPGPPEGRVARGRAGSRRRVALDWARRTLAKRGGLVLVVARYLPGGRTAVTLTTGAVGYPLRLFSSFDALGAVSWGLYCTLIGYLGGKAFEHNPVAGLLLGFGVAVSTTILVELVRRYRLRHAHRPAAAEPADRALR